MAEWKDLTKDEQDAVSADLKAKRKGAVNGPTEDEVSAAVAAKIKARQPEEK